MASLFTVMVLPGRLMAEESDQPAPAAPSEEESDQPAAPSEEESDNFVLTEQSDHLMLAEQAYAQEDLETALRHTRVAIVIGQRSRHDLTRIYELKAVCAAALEQNDEARNAYMRMLALNPVAQIDSSLASRIRTVFLEAQGSWAARHDRLVANVTLLQSREALRVNLSDPLDMGGTIVIRARAAGESEYSEASMPASARVHLFVPGAQNSGAVEFILRVLDEHGNHIIDLGSEDEPERIGEPETPPQSAGIVSQSSIVHRRVTSRAWFWAIIGSVALMAASGGIAMGMLLPDQMDKSMEGVTEVTIGIR